MTPSDVFYIMSLLSGATWILIGVVLLLLELPLKTNRVKYFEEIPRVTGLWVVVEISQYYLVFEKHGSLWIVQTDSKGKVFLSVPRKF
jgi:hypothetical protein